jgi:hypothetical protein
MKKIIALFLFILVMFYISIKTNNKLKIQEKKIDSLQTELFQSQSNEGRYEISLEILSQDDSLSASKFYNIYNNETE